MLNYSFGKRLDGAKTFLEAQTAVQRARRASAGSPAVITGRNPVTPCSGRVGTPRGLDSVATAGGWGCGRSPAVRKPMRRLVLALLLAGCGAPPAGLQPHQPAR